MPTSSPRVQVTVDGELAAALDGVDPTPASRSKLIRDLALRGAELEREEQARRERSIALLGRIAMGETDYDPASVLPIWEERERGA